MMASYWDELRPVVEAFDTDNTFDNEPPIWVGMEAEQTVWLNFRNVSCALDLSGEIIHIGAKEGQAYCRADLTQTRLDEIYARINWMCSYARERRVNP